MVVVGARKGRCVFGFEKSCSPTFCGEARAAGFEQRSGRALQSVCWVGVDVVCARAQAACETDIVGVCGGGDGWQ